MLDYLVSILESRPNTIGRGPAQVGATAAMAFGFTNPFLAARTTRVAACPPPKTTNSFPRANNKRYYFTSIARQWDDSI